MKSPNYLLKLIITKLWVYLFIIIINLFYCSLLSYCASHYYSFNFSTLCEELPAVITRFTCRETVSNIHDALQETKKEPVATKHSEIETWKSLI